MTCRNCGNPGPHFAPPSLGEPGFYTCENIMSSPTPITQEALKLRPIRPVDPRVTAAALRTVGGAYVPVAK